MNSAQKLIIFALTGAFSTAWGMETKVTSAAATEAELRRDISEKTSVLSPQVVQALSHYQISDKIKNIAWAPNGMLFFTTPEGVFTYSPAKLDEPTLVVPFNFDEETLESMRFNREYPLIALNNDGTQLAITFPQTYHIELWDITTQQPKKEKSIQLKKETLHIAIESAFFNAQGTHLTVGTEKMWPAKRTVIFYQISLATEEIALLEGPAGSSSTTLSKDDGTYSAALNTNVTIKTFNPERKLSPVWIKFSPKKNYFITASKVNKGDDFAEILTIWHTATGRPLKTICSADRIDFISSYNINGVPQKHIYTIPYMGVHTKYVESGLVDHIISFSPDEKYLAINGTLYRIDDALPFDRTLLKFIDIDAVASAQQKRKFKPRELTAQEWKVFQEFDPFSLKALLQNLKLSPPTKAIVAITAASSAGAAGKAKKS